MPKLTILNQSDGQWAFDNLAQILSRSLWVDISETPSDLNYLLCVDTKILDRQINSFIPVDSIRIAADKRAIASRFSQYNVPRPQTFILTSLAEITSVLQQFNQQSWILKYPTGCGGIHHRIIDNISQIPNQWPQPFILQEFIETSQPAVYRFYCIDGDLFGFNARKFPNPDRYSSPWISHAHGAIYDYTEIPNQEAIAVARAALIATDLYDSFGAVDLIKDMNENWYALEVGTDGIYNYIDRDLNNDRLFDEINERLAIAVWKKVGLPPWGNNWKYRE